MANRDDLNAAIQGVQASVDVLNTEMNAAFGRADAIISNGNGTPIDYQAEVDALNAVKGAVDTLTGVAQSKYV